MIEVLRKYTCSFLAAADNVAWQVRSVLNKIALCQTAVLLGRLYECPGCHRLVAVYNSCGERHCPQCSGARRSDWMDRTSQLMLPGLNYFQLVFTIPDKLSRLVLGNRRLLYRLLFRSAWRAIREEMKKQNIAPAALLVLHTWNQELQHHPHIHALVPGGGPSFNRDNDACWVTARDITRPWRAKPSLVDNVTLGRTFRDKFVRGLGWLIRNNKLKLPNEWQQLHDPKVLRSWLKSLRETDWKLFMEGPPHGQSHPQHVLKYLTKYMKGGPISDRRIESDDDGMVTFRARSKSKSKTSKQTPRRIKVPGEEFVRRWSLHVLPKGFTRSRSYGGYHGSRRQAYLETCRHLLSVEPSSPESAATRTDQSPEAAQPEATAPCCPHCQVEMRLIAYHHRPSWRVVFPDRDRPNLLQGHSHGGQLPRPDD